MKYNKEAVKEVLNPTTSIEERGSVDYMAAEPIRINSVSIDLQGEEITDEQVKNVIMNFAEVNPSLFKGGLADVRIMKGESSGFMATERNKDGNIIHIQNADIELKGGKGETFNPYQELKGAFAAIANNTPFTFKQEYSLECLWHEIRHAGAVGWKEANNKTSVNTASMEVINQFCARKSYMQFVRSIGGKAIHKKTIMNDGFGYTDEVKNFCTLLKKIGIGQGVAYKHFYKMIMTTDYESIHDKMVDFVNKRSGFATEQTKKIIAGLNASPEFFRDFLNYESRM